MMSKMSLPSANLFWVSTDCVFVKLHLVRVTCLIHFDYCFYKLVVNIENRDNRYTFYLVTQVTAQSAILNRIIRITHMDSHTQQSSIIRKSNPMHNCRFKTFLIVTSVWC